MKPLYRFGTYSLFNLSEQTAEVYEQQITDALDQIPFVEKHTLEAILATNKNDRQILAKWEHSLIALDEHGAFVGVVIGYERPSEDNELYSKPSIYMSDLAIAKDHQKQGLGKWLISSWLDHNKQIGFRELEGDLQFSTQTNSAVWNVHVQKLYESFGFKKRATKTYPNRIDIVYELIV